jgi:acetolactate synthase-1/2/3 large subunit
VGYDPIEYEARNWNKEKSAQIIVIDEVPAEIDSYFQPKRELIVNIAQTLDLLSNALAGYEMAPDATEYLNLLRGKLNERDVLPADWHVEGKLHPLEIVNTLQANVTDKMTVAVDVGSHYIWMARHFRSYVPRHLLFSNGMQTLGVALPWAIAAALVRPDETIFSISGDGGFLFSGQELETAVRLKQKIIQIIWNDGKYNMVEFQEQLKYNRTSGVDFGPVDFVKYAEAFGAKGLRATSKAGLQQAITEALASDGPVIIDVPVDYSDNAKLAETMLPDQFY